MTFKTRKTSESRTNLSSGKMWEDAVGYSRAVRMGNRILTAGTMGYDAEGNYPASAAEQTENAIRFIERALRELGGSLGDVVQTRIYVRDIDEQEEIGAVHKRWFGDVRPVTTMVEVSALATQEARVEIEVEAVLD